jgi:glycerol-3-phosphate acyltransferase PlsY
MLTWIVPAFCYLLKMYFLRIKILVVIVFFSITLTICLIKKIMQVSSILSFTCFIIVIILSSTYPFKYL